MVRNDNKRVTEYSFGAKGHDATIICFSHDTVLMPLHKDEVHKILNSLYVTFNALKATNDFPEEETYQNLMDNLKTAEFMLEYNNLKKE